MHLEDTNLREHFIYTITNIINGKKYVGYTNNPILRWRTHKNNTEYVSCAGRHLYSSMRKYGVYSFVFEVIQSGFTLEEAKKEESRLIKEYNLRDPKYGYNMTDGGDGTQNLDEVSREKMRQAQLGRKASPETREKMRLVGKEKKAFAATIPLGTIKSLWEEKKSLSEIAEKFCISAVLVRSRLKEAGIKILMGGGPRVQREDRLRAAGKENLINPDKNEVARLYLSGVNTVQLAKIYDTNHNSIADWLDEVGVPRRTKNRRDYGDARVRTEKVCPRCSVLKSLEGYNRHKQSPDGHSYLCRECERQDQKDRLLRKKQKQKKATERECP